MAACSAGDVAESDRALWFRNGHGMMRTGHLGSGSGLGRDMGASALTGGEPVPDSQKELPEGI